MSKVKTTIELRHIAGVTTEKTITTPMRCQRCLGRGYFPARSDQEPPVLCPDCAGTGMIRANIEIKWEPARVPNMN